MTARSVPPEGRMCGKHIFATAETRKVLDSGHFDAGALLAGLPSKVHDPQHCGPECPQWWDLPGRAGNTRC